jgi:hypothetical protein
MRLSMRVGLVGGCAAALLVTGCGGDSSDGGEQDGGRADRADYVDAIAEVQQDPAASEEANRCLAEAFVDVVGVEALAEAVTPDEIRDDPDTPPAEHGIEVDVEQGSRFVDLLSECSDIRGLMLDSIAIDSGPDVAACYDDTMDDELFRRYVVSVMFHGDLTGDPDLQADLAQVANSCAVTAS